MDKDEWQVVEVCEGVEIVFNPAKFEAVGMPLGISVENNALTLRFDLNVHMIVGDQDSRVENLLTLQGV
jgi:hypothetical protein